MPWEWLRISTWNCSPLEAENWQMPWSGHRVAQKVKQPGKGDPCRAPGSSAALRCLVKKGENGGMGENLSPACNQIKLSKRTGVNSCFLVQFPLSRWGKSLKPHFSTNAHFLSFWYVISTCGATGGSAKLSHTPAQTRQSSALNTHYTLLSTLEKKAPTD